MFLLLFNDLIEVDDILNQSTLSNFSSNDSNADLDTKEGNIWNQIQDIILNNVKINGYSLKTYGGSNNFDYLKNWVIEGKNEGGEWEKIDQQDNNDLIGKPNQHYYSIPKMNEPYQYIRIKNLGRNHTQNSTHYYLVLTNFEIFRAMSEN